MTQRVSEYLGVNPAKFEKRGVFDAVIGVDTRLFLDPHLLRRTSVPEFEGSRRQIESYFGNIMTLLRASREEGDRPWKEAHRRLIFRETKGVSIGYGLHSSDGLGIGPRLAYRLLNSAQEIISLGINDPEIFELLGLFEEDFGADRLSDMTIFIIRDKIYSYTERVAGEVGTGRLVDFEKRNVSYKLPLHPNRRGPLLLLPMELLRDLPVALTWEAIDHVVSTNRELRDRINQMIGSAWRNKITKQQIRNLIFSSKDNIESIINAYKESKAREYDFDTDPQGEVLWYYLGQKFGALHPLTIKETSPSDIDELESIVIQIIKQFKKNIEDNGLNEHLYAGRKRRHERFSHLLFFSTADTYCFANNIDINREPNAGSGPVDFKLSRGYRSRILVEVKLSTNTHITSGFEKQLPAYAKSESTGRTIYLIIRVTDSDKQIKNIYKLQREQRKKGKPAPAIWVVDGRLKPTASKRK
ncbi:hypothetical protein KKH23_03265 [Patescibacteria group bacterium]|nr:hypothetical protein [Patescibacteria group bacterium]MBU0777027.1 hypothetical protein [Patescibacteria group bacterium]MBU0846185.1 hypothetical protein [Patescibacteria group bacterium]MBU0923098.1 hypothetical protein [Patescibacteria group bacterium]MBU1066570.1 hypothetical protein [Patescibacteria group bacterium]